MDQEQYLKARVEDQIAWYSGKSRSNQQWYKALKTIEIVSAAVIPLVAGMQDRIPQGAVVIGLLGVVIAVCAGVSALNKYQENWLMYRAASETLQHEKYLFLTQSKPYDDADAFHQFVVRMENLLASEHTQWASLHRDKAQQQDVDQSV